MLLVVGLFSLTHNVRLLYAGGEIELQIFNKQQKDDRRTNAQ